MSEKHNKTSNERIVPADAVWKIGHYITRSLASVVDIFFPSGKS